MLHPVFRPDKALTLVNYGSKGVVKDFDCMFFAVCNSPPASNNVNQSKRPAASQCVKFSSLYALSFGFLVLAICL